MGFTVSKPDPTYEQLTMPWDQGLLPPDRDAGGLTERWKPQSMADRAAQNPSHILAMPPEESQGYAQWLRGKANFNTPVIDPSIRSPLLSQMAENSGTTSERQSMGRGPGMTRPGSFSDYNPGLNWDTPVTRMNPSNPGSLVDQMGNANEFDGRYGRWIGT